MNKNDYKLAIIIHSVSKDNVNSLLDDLSTLTIPNGYEVKVNIVKNSTNRACSYNQEMKRSNAKYKIYIDESARILNKNILIDIIRFFASNPDAGAFGLYGSEMPVDGDFAKSEKRYGMYGFCIGDNVQLIQGENPIWKQNVHCLDGSFIATSVDFEWDEKIADEYVVPAQCCIMRRHGYKISVPMYENPWCVFKKESSYCTLKDMDDLKDFFYKYKKDIQPLVSILMTTYNQPAYFKQALDSALNQDYNNIEIVIGDDSTNTDTQKLMQYYLNTYENIRYYFHNGPLGGFGRENMKFVLNHAKGEYINFLFHDDLFHPHKITAMMEWIVKDLNNEVGIITSVRNAIDKYGKNIGRVSPWQPSKDTVLTPKELGRKLLFSSSNFIGELTTVLIRKETLKRSSKEYLAGLYFENRDKANGDVATFLDIARKNYQCVFLKNIYSGLRMHSEQNTYNIDVVANSLIEWLSYIIKSWNKSKFIRDKEELYICYRNWLSVHRFDINTVCNSTNENLYDIKIFFKSIIKYIEERQYEVVHNLVADYLKKHGEMV